MGEGRALRYTKNIKYILLYVLREFQSVFWGGTISTSISGIAENMPTDKKPLQKNYQGKKAHRKNVNVNIPKYIY